MIQEIGRAARDKQPAKSVLFYSRGDIWSVYSIVSSGRERYFFSYLLYSKQLAYPLFYILYI
jgi:superfamily II DNA helicase RecQ